jgi:hypothetical protein
LIVACDGVGTSKIWMLAIGSEIQKEISDIWYMREVGRRFRNFWYMSCMPS